VGPRSFRKPFSQVSRGRVGAELLVGAESCGGGLGVGSGRGPLVLPDQKSERNLLGLLGCGVEPDAQKGSRDESGSLVSSL